MEEIECCVISENPCKNSKIVKSILEEPLEEKKKKVFSRKSKAMKEPFRKHVGPECIGSVYTKNTQDSSRSYILYYEIYDYLRNSHISIKHPFVPVLISFYMPFFVFSISYMNISSYVDEYVSI